MKLPVIRKFHNPSFQVFYKDQLIGLIENHTEFVWFRLDIVKSKNHKDFHLLTADSQKIIFDKNGTPNDYSPFWETWSEAMMELVFQLGDL